MQSETTQDTQKRGIPPVANAKTGRFSKGEVNIQPHRHYDEAPIKPYNSAHETESSSARSFFDSICSPSRSPVTKPKDSGSPPCNSETLALDSYQGSSQAERGESSKGTLDVHWKNNQESDTPNSQSGHAEHVNEASPPKPFRMSDIQDGDDKLDRKVQGGHGSAANPVTNAIEEDAKCKYAAKSI